MICAAPGSPAGHRPRMWDSCWKHLSSFPSKVAQDTLTRFYRLGSGHIRNVGKLLTPLLITWGLRHCLLVLGVPFVNVWKRPTAFRNYNCLFLSYNPRLCSEPVYVELSFDFFWMFFLDKAPRLSCQYPSRSRCLTLFFKVNQIIYKKRGDNAVSFFLKLDCN